MQFRVTISGYHFVPLHKKVYFSLYSSFTMFLLLLFAFTMLACEVSWITHEYSKHSLYYDHCHFTRPHVFLKLVCQMTKCLKVGVESNPFPVGWFVYLIIDLIIFTFSHNTHSCSFDPSLPPSPVLWVWPISVQRQFF